jgi:hypothetical protein
LPKGYGTASSRQRDLELTKLLEEVAQREKDRYAIDTFLHPDVCQHAGGHL